MLINNKSSNFDPLGNTSGAISSQLIHKNSSKLIKNSEVPADLLRESAQTLKQAALMGYQRPKTSVGTRRMKANKNKRLIMQ